MPSALELTQCHSRHMGVPQQMLAGRKEGMEGRINPAGGTKADAWVIERDPWQPGLGLPISAF